MIFHEINESPEWVKTELPEFAIGALCTADSAVVFIGLRTTEPRYSLSMSASEARDLIRRIENALERIGR